MQPRHRDGRRGTLRPTDFDLVALRSTTGGPLEAPPYLDVVVGYGGSHRYISLHIDWDGRPVIDDGVSDATGFYAPFALWAHHVSVWPVLVSAQRATTRPGPVAGSETRVVLDRLTRYLYMGSPASVSRFLAAANPTGPPEGTAEDSPEPPTPGTAASDAPDFSWGVDRREREEYWAAQEIAPLLRAAVPRMEEWLGSRPLPCPTCDADLVAGAYVPGPTGHPACPACGTPLYGPALFGRIAQGQPVGGGRPQRVDDLAATWSVDGTNLVPGRGRAFVGPDGLKVLLCLDSPDPRTTDAVERGKVGIGVVAEGDADGALVLGVGEPGTPGHVEVDLDVHNGAEWWGAKVEIALVDQDGRICARRRFVAADFREAAEAGPAGMGSDDVYVKVYPGKRLGLVQPRGALTTEAVVAHARALVGSPEWQPGFTELWDVRAVDEVFFSPFELADLHRIEVETARCLEGSKTVVVAPPRPMLIYAARTYARFADRHFGRTIVVCERVEDALREVPLDSIPSLSDPTDPG